MAIKNSAPFSERNRKRAISVQSIRLQQHVAELDAAVEALERSRLAALVSDISGLGNGHALRLGIQTHLGNERPLRHQVFDARCLFNAYDLLVTLGRSSS
ncbi:hypothetical protein KQ297_11300 [Synechococcus sp. CS-205]|nr:hypothetical protein [Synechococcus sp. CS-205]